MGQTETNANCVRHRAARAKGMAENRATRLPAVRQGVSKLDRPARGGVILTHGAGCRGRSAENWADMGGRMKRGQGSPET